MFTIHGKASVETKGDQFQPYVELIQVGCANPLQRSSTDDLDLGQCPNS